MMEEKKIRRQDKWDAKAGIGAKAYKVNLEVDKEFKATCDKVGIPYGPTITKLMKEFIERHSD